MSSRLALHFLGIPELILDNTPITTDRRKAVALLAYLGVNGGKYSREFLSGLLWPDYDQAKAFSNLRRTIWEVHQAIGEDWLIADRESVSLNGNGKIELDVTQFKDLLSQASQQSDISFRIPLLSDAVKLYRNHFLTGFSLKDSYSFNEWAYAESEELRGKLSDALTTLSDDYCALGQAEKAIPYARRLIALDPLNEAFHRQLMEVYIQAGQHNAALKQYQTCEQILRKELNLDPQPETRALYKKIRKLEMKPVHAEEKVETTESKHNLPLQLSSFIGREKETDDVANLLAKHRLVTLAGVGGIGKTRLSLQVGQRLLNEYADGVWFIPLDSLAEPARVPQTVASVFDIREGPNRPVVEILINVLSEKTTLLILDNCEHLLDSCAQFITTLLRNCPNLKVLATSRETLSTEGEAAYYLPSLSIPDKGASLEKLTACESIQLFTERAVLALSSFRLTKENAQPIRDICRRVDGIPLGIELAAGWIGILQVDEIRKQLESRFDLLIGKNRKALERHQAMRASLDWSWALLTEPEQRFMQQVSIFAGGWILESAQAVCDGDVLTLTSALAKKSLIAVYQESGRETRYRFHEFVRQYAHEKLGESGEEVDIRMRHLKYFVDLSELAESALRGPEQIEWMARLNDERDNIRAALTWADQTNTEAGLYISSRLERFWESFDIREENYWLSTFLQKPESQAYPRARAMALHAYLPVLNLLNQVDLWRSTAKECLDLYRTLGNQRGETDVLLITAEEISSPTERMELFRRSHEIGQALDDVWRQARVLLLMGWNSSGDERLAHWKRAITLFRQSGDWHSLAFCLSSMGNFAVLNGDLDLAQKSLDEANVLNDQLKDKSVETNILYAYGQIAMIRREYEQAHIYFQETMEILEELGIRLGWLFTRAQSGYLALREGKAVEARVVFSETTQNFQKDQNIIGVVFSLEGMAGLYITVNKPEKAARLVGWADMTREKIRDTRPLLEQADVDKIITACIMKMGEAAFSDAYDEGQKMSMDQAIALALNEH